MEGVASCAAAKAFAASMLTVHPASSGTLSANSANASTIVRRSSSSCARLFGVKNDRVERTGGGTIAFEQAPNVDALVFVRVERCRERFKRRVELVPFRGAFANLFAKVFGFQLISKLRLGGNMRVELLDKFASVVREVVEAFFLKVAKSSKR